MLKYSLFICMFLLWSGLLSGQGSAITGIVTHKGQPLEWATVQLVSDEMMRNAHSDPQGHFSFNDLSAGTYQLSVSMIGYVTFRKEIELRASETKDVFVSLTEDFLQLEQIVITGTRTEVPVYHSPVIVNKISDRTFEATQSLSLSEGLNFTPGLRVENNCQNCGFTQLRMNGLDGAYSQILINSRPIFSSLAGVYGLDMIPANMVDRVEVVKGGGSVMYGGNAIGGTVNIITKDPIENSFQAGYNHGLIDGASNDRTLTFNGSLVDKTLDKGISIYGFHRNRDYWDANGDGFSEITQLENTTLGIDGFHKLDKRNKIKFNINAISEFRRGGNKFDLKPHQTDITEQLDHMILGAGLSYEHYSRDLDHKISLYTSAQMTNRDSYYGGGGRILQEGDSLTSEDILALNAYGESKDLAGVAGLQYTYKISERMILSAGSEFQYNDVEDEMPGYQRRIEQTVSTLGTYSQLEWDAFARLRLLFGLRYDHVVIDGAYDLEGENFNNQRNLDIVVPRLTALYSITEKWKARASFAQGYRAPQAFDEDLHIETVGGAARFIQLDPNLDVERSNNLTLSINYTNSEGRIQSNFVFEGFYTQLNDPFILTEPEELENGVSVIQKKNGDGARIQGFNTELNLAFPANVILQGGLTVQRSVYDSPEVLWSPSEPEDGRDPVTTERLLRAPNVYGFFTLSYEPIKSLSISWSGVYTGPMDVPHVIDPEDEYTVIKTTTPFLENNFKVSKGFEIGDNSVIEISAGVQNIFNAYQDDLDMGADRDAGYVYGPMRPRTYFAGIKFKFR